MTLLRFLQLACLLVALIATAALLTAPPDRTTPLWALITLSLGLPLSAKRILEQITILRIRRLLRREEQRAITGTSSLGNQRQALLTQLAELQNFCQTLASEQRWVDSAIGIGLLAAVFGLALSQFGADFLAQTFPAAEAVPIARLKALRTSSSPRLEAPASSKASPPRAALYANSASSASSSSSQSSLLSVPHSAAPSVPRLSAKTPEAKYLAKSHQTAIASESTAAPLPTPESHALVAGPFRSAKK